MAGFWDIVVNGTPLNLDSFGCYVEAVQGVGVPSVNNISLEYAQGDGALYQQTFAKPRTFTLQVYVPGTSLANFHALRKALWDALKPNRAGVITQQPLVLRYSGGGTRTVLINAVYDSGLEWTTLSGFTERFRLRFIAYDPYWYATSNASSSFTTQNTVSGADYIIQRDATGDWKKLTGGPTAAVSCLAQDTAGNLYVGGTFTAPGNRIAKWNGSAWSTLSTGTNGAVNDVTIGPDGYLYAVGAFTTPAAAVAKWSGSAWSAVGSGLTGTAYTCVFGNDGVLYVSGILSISGVPTYIAKWNGSAWSSAGSLTAYTNALAVAPNGNLYSGTSATSASGVALYDGSSFTDIGVCSKAGGAATVYHLAVGPDGYLYACGNFDTIGGVPASGVAKWNGSVWQPLGSGLGGLTAAYAMSFDEQGILYVVGKFTSAGGFSLADSAAKWNGSIWSSAGVNLPGAPDIRAILTRNNKITFGYTTSGSAIVPTVVPVTNNGTADAFPVLEFSGTGRVYEITNATTGDSLFFNLALYQQETATLDLTPGNKTFISSFRGNIVGTISPDSDFATFRLAPGVNNLTLYTANNATATISFRERYWSIDGGA